MLVSKMYSTPKVAKFLQYRLAWYSNLPQYWWGVRPVLFFGESCWMCVVWVRLKNEVKNILWTCTQKARTRSKEKVEREKLRFLKKVQHYSFLLLLFSTISSKWWLYIDIFMKKEVLLRFTIQCKSKTY